MTFNELFRMVSLRQTTPTGNAARTRTDPRVRHSARIRDQASVKPSPRDEAIAELKKKQKDAAARFEHLESIQRLLVRAHLTDSVAVAARPTGHTEAGRAVASSPAAGNVARGLEIRNLGQQIERRLGTSALETFNGALGTIAGDTHADLSDLLTALDPGSLVAELNRTCSQIHEIENPGQGLPTVSDSPATAPGPLVSAVGWGDLVVARESLVGYDAREIAHIENILPGESKLRVHERISKTEEVDESETTTEKESEKDSQTTDRYELQAESQESINQDFSISTGVNVSAQYGVTQVETSLDAAFSQSQSQSQSSSINTAKEIVSKAVERTFEKVRRLRRLTVTEQIRELNRHKLSNSGTQTSSPISGMYLFVEKIQKVELRHYGTRMMLEFHIPEPAISLLESVAASASGASLPPFNVYPGDIHPGNYLCEAQRYGAPDVRPPPTLFIQVGWGWNSKMFEDGEQWAEDAFNDLINIPTGYRPIAARVAWSGLRGKLENREFNFSFAVGGRSQENVEHTTTTYDGVVLQLRADTDWPQGVPVTGRVHGTWDGAMYVHVTLTCMRTAEALDSWRLQTWQALQAGYEVLERKFSQRQQQRAYQMEVMSAIGESSTSSEYRRIERGELQKWIIKSMRLVPQNFNAIEQVGDSQEMDPESAEAQAPIVRFYEDSFEWEHMTYFLYPYHWARRASWRARLAAKAADVKHQAFLEAGAARVIVPVTPGFEAKVAWFLDPSNGASNELERILGSAPSAPPSAADPFHDLWTELLTEHRPELARGSGTLAVVNGNAEVTVSDDSKWRLSTQRDAHREVYISGERYEISAVNSETVFRLDRPYEGTSDLASVYVAGSTPFGPPWTVNVPTSLVVLAENVPALRAVGT